jgi:hypothetical protein
LLLRAGEWIKLIFSFSTVVVGEMQVIIFVNSDVYFLTVPNDYREETRTYSTYFIADARDSGFGI